MQSVPSAAPTIADQADVTDVERLTSQARSLLAEAQALSARLAALNEVTVMMQDSLDLDAVLRTMADQARWVIDFQHCAIALREHASYRYTVLRGTERGASLVRPLSDDLISRVLNNGHAQLLPELEATDGAPAGMRSALLLPLRQGGQTIGVLNFFARKPQHYSQDDLRIAYALGIQVAAILQNVRFYQAATRARDELHTILESIRDAVLVVDLAGRVVLLNSALRQALHLPTEPFTDQSWTALLRLARTGERPLVKAQSLRPLLASLRTESAVHEGTLRLGDGRHLAWAIAPLLEDGQIRGYVLTGRDVTEQIRVEQMREDLTHMLVHDLRSPLGSVMMSLDMIQMAFSNNNATLHGEMLDFARRFGRRLLDQVNTLLDVSKLEAGRLELNLGPVKLSDMIDQQLASFRLTADAGKRNLAAAYDPATPLLWADVRLLQRVFENLISNALKFTPDLGTVTVGTHVVDRMVEVWVQDTGRGVPPELREHIFEKFSQVSGPDQYRGTGLGLTFCKLVIEAHGGSIGVRDALGGGSLFWFRLPANVEEWD